MVQMVLIWLKWLLKRLKKTSKKTQKNNVAYTQWSDADLMQFMTINEIRTFKGLQDHIKELEKTGMEHRCQLKYVRRGVYNNDVYIYVCTKCWKLRYTKLWG